MTFSHPLFEAKLRHDRANEHLTYICAKVETVHDGSRAIAAYEDLNNEPVVRTIPKPPQPTLDLSIRVGEMIYNLRAALDFLVFALARFDSGKPRENTQFPIERREQVFWQQRAFRLPGITDEHVAMIEEYQPYRGCEWTETLASVSNPDRHRELRVLVATFDPNALGFAELRFGPMEEADERQGRKRRMEVHFNVAADVAFADGLPVVETLETLQAEVGRVLDRFTPEFFPADAAN